MIQHPLLIASTVISALVYASGALALTNQPVVTAESTAPRKATIVWDIPDEVETDSKTITSWELGYAQNIDFTNVTTTTVAADALSADLTKADGLRGQRHYYVRVRAMYSDDTTSNYGTTNFYSKIGKLTGLRTVSSDVEGVVTVKWKKPTREGNTLNYKVKLYRKHKVVFKDSVYGKNNLTISGLKPGKRYQFKVRAVQLSTYGKGRWSDLKSFTAN